VTTDELAHARWSQRIGNNGDRVEVALRDGRLIRSDGVYGTLNRLLYPPQGDLLLIQAADRGYVFHELMAVFMGWLGALPGPMLNPPAPDCLSGRLRSFAEWVWLAGKVGLATPRYRTSSDGGVFPPALHVRAPDAPAELTALFVVGDAVASPAVPETVAAACRRLAALAHAPLLGFEFSSGWTLAGVNARPDLRLGGEELLDALAATLGAAP
jgi:hypothetical protein